jgi:hypothetical protein
LFLSSLTSIHGAIQLFEPLPGNWRREKETERKKKKEGQPDQLRDGLKHPASS